MTAGDGRLRFGDCELDPATRQLWRAGEPVALEPRVFDLLVFLVEERHRAVDKDAIQDAVWQSMVVSETALTRAIMKARRAVGDDADSQSVIRTVHGHGYQFVAALEDDEKTVAASPSAEPLAPASRNRLRLIFAAAAFALTVAIVWLVRTPSVPDNVRVAVLPVANATGDAGYDWAKYGLMGLANDLFVDATDLEIVSTADMARFAENVGWSGDLDDADAGSQLDTLRRAYGATHVLVSQLEENVGGLRLTYTLVSPDGRRENQTMVSNQAPELVHGMVRGVGTILGSRRPDLPENIEIVATDPFINEAYARGMSFSLEGRCAEALPLFEVVIARSDGVNRARSQWATCARILGRWQEAESAYREMLATLDAETASSLKANVIIGLGVLLHETGRNDEAAATYQRGFDEAVLAEDRRAQGRVLVSMAILAKDRRQFDEARDLLARSTLAYRELEWEILPGQIFGTLANIGMTDGKLDEAEQNLNEALQSFRALGDRRNEAMMLNNYGYLRRLQGRFEEALPLHLQSLDIRREIGDRVGQGRILGMLSILYVREGRYEEARDAAAEALAIAREANDRLYTATGLAQLASAERQLGNVGEARIAYEESRETFIEIEDQSRAAQVDLRLAQLDMDEERFDVAEERIDAVLQRTLAADLPEPAIEAMHYAGDLARLRGNPTQATASYERALSHMQETGTTSGEVDVTVKLADLYIDQARLDAVEPLLGFLVEQDSSAGILKIRARYAHATGENERAITLMEEAKAEAGDQWTNEDAATLTQYRNLP